MTGISVSSTAL